MMMMLGAAEVRHGVKSRIKNNDLFYEAFAFLVNEVVSFFCSRVDVDVVISLQHTDTSHDATVEIRALACVGRNAWS